MTPPSPDPHATSRPGRPGLSPAVVPAAAAAVIAAWAVWRADAALETGVLAAAVLGLVAGHLLLRSRTRRRTAAEETRRLEAEFELRERAADCERRREGLAAFARLASHVAHEVRNPLSSIALNAEMLGDEIAQCHCPTSPAMQQLLASMQRETARLHRLTEEYLLVARPPRLSLAPSDLNAVIDDVVGLVREEASRSAIRIETDLSWSAASVVIDHHQIRQALLNLIRNAFQAMPAGGRLRLATDGNARRVLVSVADTGPGIPADQRFLVFEPFYSTKEGGTGLGLPMTMQIAREHGGLIELGAWSGGGACFTLVLPRDGVGPVGDADSVRAVPPVDRRVA